VTDREVFRLAPPVILWWVWLAFVAVNVADYAIQGLPSARFGAILAAALLLVTGLAYTLALRPRVLADADGLTVVNPYRVHRLPWTAIEAVDTAEWVRVRPVSGRAVYCWALYVSAGAKRKTARADASAARASAAARPARPGSAGRPARGWAERLRGNRGMLGGEPAVGQVSGRLPQEARYLASLPPAKAMAIRLDRRAERERLRAPALATTATGGPGATGAPGAPAATATWSWPALAAVAAPALILLVVAVV
jgi:hypothetical protein